MIHKCVLTYYGLSHSDIRMKSKVFYENIANIFHSYLIKKDIKLQVIIFVNGH